MEALPKVNAEQLQKYLKGQVVLMFTADWCPDCQFIKPAMQEVSQSRFLSVYPYLSGC